MRQEVRVSRMLESFSEKISQMSKTDEDNIAEIGQEKDVVGWVLLFVVGNGLATRVLRGEAEFFVRAMAKL